MITETNDNDSNEYVQYMELMKHDDSDINEIEINYSRAIFTEKDEIRLNF